MIEQRNLAPIDADVLTPGNHALATSKYNFEKYDLYVEKLRSLFVPSLESRIHRCLESFVYCEAADEQLCPRLRRCLEMAATWREPVGAFCTKWGDEGYLENILSHAAKYLIKDGLVDCFLNSIILNNRLNKVCRDLDRLGVERDLLRYLTVWNYMNERDYWLEDNRRVSTTTSRRSHESIDRNSDLDVEIGSKFPIDHEDGESRRSLKRKASDDSSEDLQGLRKIDDPLNDHVPDPHKLENWLSVNSNSRRESKSSDRKKMRSLCQNYPCRPSTCPFYRREYYREGDWDGKVLKVKLFKACSTKYEPWKTLETSKLRLPCQYEDLIAKIVNTDLTLLEFGSISRRKKFQTSMNSVCHRVNELSRKMDKNEVRRCRLDCEIFPGHLSFKIVERAPNGCEITLLNERIVINKIDTTSRSASRGSSVSKLTPIAENENSEDNSGRAENSIDDKSPKTIEAPEQKVKVDSIEISNIAERPLEPTESRHSRLFVPPDNLSSLQHENIIEEGTCDCKISADNKVDNFDDKSPYEEERLNSNNSTIQENGNASKEMLPEGTSSSDHTPEEPVCLCDFVFNGRPNYDNPGLDNSRKSGSIPEYSPKLDNTKESSSKKSLESTCRSSTEVNKIEGKRKNSDRELVKESSTNSITEHSSLKCLCSADNTLAYPKNDFEENKCIRMGYAESSERPHDRVSNTSEFLSNSIMNLNEQQNRKFVVTDDQGGGNPSTRIKSHVMHAKPREESLDPGNIRDTACECPADCICENKDVFVGGDFTSPSDESDPGSNKVDLDYKQYVPDFLNGLSNRKFENSSTFKNDFLELIGGPLNSNVLEPLPRICGDIGPKTAQSQQRDDKSCVSVGCDCLELYNLNGRPVPEASPIISARLPRSKAQKINISIELCPDSESSLDKVTKYESPDISVRKTIRDKLRTSKTSEPKLLSSLRRFRSRSVGDSDKSVIAEKNVCPGNPRMNSSTRPPEAREQEISLDEIPAARGPNASMTSRSNRKRGRSVDQGKGAVINGAKREPCRPMRYKRCGKVHERPRQKESSSPKNPNKFTANIDRYWLKISHSIDSHSIDRMTNLFKTKLRRILLERDNSTNTPKFTLANRKYRVSVPNGKIGRYSASRRGCRTIWESRSASGSTGTTGSFASENQMGLRDMDKITQLLYSASSDGPKNLPKFRNFNQTKSTASSYSKNDTARSMISKQNFQPDRQNFSFSDSVNNTRLAGGSDRGNKAQMPFLSSTKRPPAKNVNHYVRHLPIKKSSQLSDYCVSEKAQDKFEKDSIAPCGRLDSPINSTSRHIYLHEFDQYESPKDGLSKYRWNKRSPQNSRRRATEMSHCTNEYPRSTKKVGKNNARELKHSKQPKNAHQQISRPHMSSELKNISPDVKYDKKGFKHLDHDLRVKLSQYLTLCKNIKCSLLKRIRPDFEVSGVSDTLDYRFHES